MRRLIALFRRKKSAVCRIKPTILDDAILGMRITFQLRDDGSTYVYFQKMDDGLMQTGYVRDLSFNANGEETGAGTAMCQGVADGPICYGSGIEDIIGGPK